MEISKEEIKKKIEEMGGLISEDVAISLLKKEKPRELKVNEIVDGFIRVSLKCKILSSYPLEVFPSGKKKKVFLVGDETGRKKLNIWNDQIKMFSDVMVGDEILLTSIYQKNGELNIGYKCELKIIKKSEIKELSSLEYGFLNTQGFVSEIKGYKEINNRKVFVLTLSDKTNSVDVYIWEFPGRGEFLKEGMFLRLEQVKYDGKLNIYQNSRMSIKKRKEGVKGKIEEIFEKEGQFFIKIGEDSIPLNRDDLKQIFGPIPEDISIKTVAFLQNLVLKGKDAFLYNENGKINLAVKSAK